MREFLTGLAAIFALVAAVVVITIASDNDAINKGVAIKDKNGVVWNKLEVKNRKFLVKRHTTRWEQPTVVPVD